MPSKYSNNSKINSNNYKINFSFNKSKISKISSKKITIIFPITITNNFFNHKITSKISKLLLIMISMRIAMIKVYCKTKMIILRPH